MRQYTAVTTSAYIETNVLCIYENTKVYFVLHTQEDTLRDCLINVFICITEKLFAFPSVMRRFVGAFSTQIWNLLLIGLCCSWASSPFHLLFACLLFIWIFSLFCSHFLHPHSDSIIASSLHSAFISWSSLSWEEAALAQEQSLDVLVGGSTESSRQASGNGGPGERWVCSTAVSLFEPGLHSRKEENSSSNEQLHFRQQLSLNIQHSFPLVVKGLRCLLLTVIQWVLTNLTSWHQSHEIYSSNI